MSFRKTIKRFIYGIMDSIFHSLAVKNEIRKYKAPERVRIYSKIALTEEQKTAINSLYFENYGKKISYVWHQNYMAHSDKFDAAYFPEILYIPEFEKYMNLWQNYASVFSDKNVLQALAAHAGVKMPKSILSITKSIIKNESNEAITRDEAVHYLSNRGKLFVKPTVDSCSGNGCFIINMVNGIDTLSGKTVSEILDSVGIDAVFQEVLTCHDSIKNIYSGSVNTFRIITYRWKQDIFHMPINMRIGQGGHYLDNAHAGGMFIAVDDDGSLHDFAVTEFNDRFYNHPDTGLVFKGTIIPNMESVIDAAKKMHEEMPQLGVINWDFTIDQDGNPVLIEANTQGGSIWLAQMVHGRSIFGERTAEVLRWLRLMKKTNPLDRAKYAFGAAD